MRNKYNKVIIAIIFLGLMASLPIIFHRHELEEKSRIIDLVMDYDDIALLANREGCSIEQALEKFHIAGINSIAIYDTTLKKLHESGRVTVISGADIARGGYYNPPNVNINEPPSIDKDIILQTVNISGEVTWLQRYRESGQVVDGDICIINRNNSDDFSEVTEDLRFRLGSDRVRVLNDGLFSAVVVKADMNDLLKTNLGLSTREIRQVNEAGLAVLSRPTNYNRVTSQMIDSVFNRIDKVKKLSGIMFVGQEVLGFPDNIPYTAGKMNERQVTLGLIEHPVQLQFVRQDGLFDLAKLVKYRAARAYAIPKDEQPKMELATAVHRWALSDQERDIRIDLLRPFEKAQPGKNIMVTNTDYVSTVAGQLQHDEFKIGPPGLFDRGNSVSDGFPNIGLYLMVAIAIIAGGILLCAQICTLTARQQYISILIAVILVIISSYWSSTWLLMRQLTALISAIVFPVLAMTIALDLWSCDEKVIGRNKFQLFGLALVSLFKTALIAFCGAFLLAAVLADVRFLLEIEIFRGVKATFVLPLLLMIFIYLTRYDIVSGDRVVGVGGMWQRICKILDYPVQIKTLILFGMAGLALIVLIGRSGHTEGMPVPILEIKMRTALEYLTYARPREKEFIIGHPAFLLSFLVLFYRWPRWLHFCAIVAAVIGQGSMVETFAHMRTPFLMSFVRGLDGLIAGALLGLILMLVIILIYWFIHRYPIGYNKL